MTNEWLQLLPALLAGGALGAVFFGGLAWTVRRGLASAHPARWFLGSLLLRTGLVLGGFYLLGASDWRRWLAALAGFTLARLALARLTRARASVGEFDHAS